MQRGTIHQAYMEAHYPDTELRLYGTQDEAISTSRPAGSTR